MGLPAKHIEFIRLVANGESQTKAYKVTCGNPGITTKVAKVKGSQLAKRYADEIEKAKNRNGEIIQKAHEKHQEKVASMRFMSVAERMELLSKLAEGTLKIKVPFYKDGKVLEYNAEPSASERIKAIAELNKMNGAYAPTEIKGTLDIRAVQVIIPGEMPSQPNAGE